ncbi:hypothetical protein [Sphingomonas sp. DT-204]|uniref:hypothetical protein n=1 Tax=Sphingomonas sp. DT-204 TaxID=3396166 RepID=UPI003F1CF31A
MRKATVASLLILCGSTAAIAHVASAPADSGPQNWSANNSTMPENSTTPTSPDTTTTPDTSTTPDTGTPPNATM